MHIFALSEGFGLNTDVLETNILNLAVVLAVVIVYGGDVFSSILETRRERIVKSVASAEEKYQEAQAALQKAQGRLDEAKKLAEEIRAGGGTAAQNATALVAKQSAEDLARLEEVKNSTLALAEQKAVKEIQQELITAALEKALAKVTTRLQNKATQKAFVDLQITTLRAKA
jgi:F-type H+-transporting ATPase subunit b|mmetsp:Transcript_17687/g.60409  ORF Transcript_17687/g.60409 Transcript_17687/m.60409 type:complete len:172 (+) Transcript_17687:1448-1963(+)